MRWLTLFLFLFLLSLSLAYGVSGCWLFTPEAYCFDILWNLRLPRTLAAIWAGFMLSGAGVISQGLFRNPLASPGILGISSGASTGVGMAFLLGWTSAAPLAALVGCLSVSVFMLLWSTRCY